ncbi:hypothetical protein AB0G64_09430 [Streptomyces longwoodensis]|uniref:hypothetical protein n=1 Tax=Streptomyces longwoodensis TaxID=68231 RepID=UPI0033DE91D1
MYRARETFWAPGNRRIEKGDIVAAGDQVLQGREDLFQEVEVLRIPPADRARQHDDQEQTPHPQHQEPAATTGAAPAAVNGPATETATADDHAPSTTPVAGTPDTAAAKKPTAAKRTAPARKAGDAQ